jgi:three-Cys-motif partner protein
MTPSRENEWVIASDGLRGRRNGRWGQEKLSSFDDFLPAALKATGTKRERHFVDLFVGPGRNVDPTTSEEFEGSAIRVLRSSAHGDDSLHFTHAVLVNKDSDDQAALESRVERLRESGGCRIPEKHLEFLNVNANLAVNHIMRRIHQKAYALIFADITRPSHWKWSSVRALRNHGHASVDLYMLFPLHMAINRMTSFNSQTMEESGPALNEFFGTDEWQELVAQRQTDAQSRNLRRALLALYMDRLKALGWQHVLVARDVRRTGDAGLYQMIYASNHPAGGRIARWSADRPDDNQQSLF